LPGHPDHAAVDQLDDTLGASGDSGIAFNGVFI